MVGISGLHSALTDREIEEETQRLADEVSYVPLSLFGDVRFLQTLTSHFQLLEYGIGIKAQKTKRRR